MTSQRKERKFNSEKINLGNILLWTYLENKERKRSNGDYSEGANNKEGAEKIYLYLDTLLIFALTIVEIGSKHFLRKTGLYG